MVGLGVVGGYVDVVNDGVGGGVYVLGLDDGGCDYVVFVYEYVDWCDIVEVWY